jgi:hypothetical protein
MGGMGGAGGAGGGEPVDNVHKLTLCIPSGIFTFQVGETLQVSSPFVSGRGIDFITPTRTVVVRSGSTFAEYPLRSDMVLKPVLCDGDRMACGGYARPATFDPSAGDPIEPGKEAIVEGADGKMVRVVLGRSEQVLATREACEPGRSELGIKADYIVVIEEGGM